MTERRLAAILVADVVGYSKLVGADEVGTLARLQALRREVIEPAIGRHAGRLFKAMGDGFLVEFASAVQAVEAARAIQQANVDGPLPLRIGIHVGDVVVQGEDLMGDGVNIAARIEAVAEAGGIAISRAVHEQVRDRLDVGFADKGEIELKNIARPVHVFVVAGTKAKAPTPALALPDKPSIAVLPFQNMSGDPEQEYFADGMVEDIITALSRFKSLFVIARNSSFAYKGRSPDVRQVGRELGVRYVLEGSVRKAGGRVRITGQLIDSGTGAHLWADRFDGSLEDVFTLQDRVTTSVVGAIAPKVGQVEIQRARHKPTESLSAYDHYLRAMASLYQLTGPATDKALQLLDSAIELDPAFAEAHGLKAFCFSWRMMSGWMGDRTREIAETELHARRAVELAKDDAAIFAMAGYSLAVVAGEMDDGVALVDRALELNPNMAGGWATSAWLRVYLGQTEMAIEHAERAMRLSPMDLNMQSIRNAMARAHFNAGRFDKAASWARAALQAKADFKPALRMAAAAEALAGHMAAAGKFRERLLQLDPGFRIVDLAHQAGPNRPEDLAVYKDGLRKAGLPE